jgi:3-isopropylmalate dehydratase small subunit
MQPFTSHTAVAAPLIKDDVNTDQIAPILHVRGLKEDYRAMLFQRARRREDGSEDPDFVLNKPQFHNAGILVTGENFGAGSSRESAVWSMLANGIRVIVAKSFADIYRENCLQNGLLPVVLGAELGDRFIARVVAVDGQAPFTVDLLSQRISGPGGPDIAFEIPAADRTRLIEGLDDIGLTLKHDADIASWEARAKTAQPWLQSARDSRQSQMGSKGARQ